LLSVATVLGCTLSVIILNANKTYKIVQIPAARLVKPRYWYIAYKSYRSEIPSSKLSRATVILWLGLLLRLLSPRYICLPTLSHATFHCDSLHDMYMVYHRKPRTFSFGLFVTPVIRVIRNTYRRPEHQHQGL
jgi:hypothetical protein